MPARPLRLLGALTAAIALAVLTFALRGPLLRWFGLGGDPAASTADAGTPRPHLPDPAIPPLQIAFSAYEQVRGVLARDSLAELPQHAQALSAALGEARAILGKQAPQAVASAHAAAATLAETTELEAARATFGDVSRAMVTLAALDPRVAEGWSLFECPMVTGYNRWLQPDAQMANPYMGTRMLKCGTSVALETVAEAPGHAHPDPEGVAYYTCPMHPSVRSQSPGACPLCGMDLTPVTHGALANGEVTVDEVRRQRIGVKVEAVRRGPLAVPVRTVGTVKYDETKLTDVSLKVSGWIRSLKVDSTGKPVQRGQVLFHLYSPELLAAQHELLASHHAEPQMAEAARKRLRLWDVADGDIDALVKKGAPIEAMPIRARASGVVIEKEVVEGASVQAGMRAFRIAPLDPIWIEAQAFESDLPFVKVGQPVEVTIPALPGVRFSSKVDFIYPSLESETRTARFRVVAPNPNHQLRAQMYAEVSFQVNRGVALKVPTSAVIYTGPRRLVFVDLGEGRLRPREVKLGIRAGDFWEVTDGLTEGEKVVTSGNFLIAAESRLRSAAEYWSAPQSAPATEPQRAPAPGGDHAGH